MKIRSSSIGASDKRPTIISLYTGAGGLDLGFKAARFETRVAVQFDADAEKMLRRNRDLKTRLTISLRMLS